jgi:Flp pilus assembly protein TadD
MWRVGWMLGLALTVAGCATEAEERVRFYNADGIQLFQHGEYIQAAEDFRAALTLHPDDAALIYNTGRCYDNLGDTARAEGYYTKCLQLAPTHAECHHALASLFLRAGRKDDAARLVQDWLTREPKRAAAYAEDGWLCHEFGDLPRAQARLQQALELDPHEPRALVELARVYEALQRPDRAKALYERILEQDPDQPEVTKRVNLLTSRGVGPPKPE